MDPSGSSFSPRNLTGAEVHSEDPYDVADNICRLATGRFEGMVWSGCQHPQMQAAPIDVPFERTVLSPLSMPPPSSSSASLEEPPHLTQLSYATAHDQYAGHELPVVDDFRQGFMGDGYGHFSQPSLGEQWPTIPGDDFLVNLEQDATASWEPYSVAGHQHPLAIGGDVVMDITPTALTPNSGPLVFRCQHHTGDQPCGTLVDGDILHALEHFSLVHVQPMFTTSGSPWICRWGGECDAHLGKGSWRRHVVAHLVRWRCSNCLQTYSRDDSARKHAKKCGGNGHIFMVPQLDDHPA